MIRLALPLFPKPLALFGGLSGADGTPWSLSPPEYDNLTISTVSAYLESIAPHGDHLDNLRSTTRPLGGGQIRPYYAVGSLGTSALLLVAAPLI